MKTIFTNGCFDILHLGHVELLKFCSTLGDKVIVGLNSDASVTSLKGTSRPINNQYSRKNMLLSLKYVDDVIIFDKSTPHNLIKQLSPDIIVKGGDYKKESVVGNDIAEVVIFDMIKGYSTSKIILDAKNSKLVDKSKFDIKFVPKGWGFEKWIVNTGEYCGKLLYFVKDKRCSWHYHELKDEVFYVQSGKILVKYSEEDDLLNAKELILNPGDNFHVYRGLRHQMIALQDTELFEFSTQHFDSDSYRIKKGD